MPFHAINEESLFFLRVEAFCGNQTITCTPDMGIVQMARLMREHDISGLIVIEHGTPVGVVSVRDFRNLIATSSISLSTLRAREIMSTGLVTLKRQDYVFEAIFKMAKYNIHRLVVLDDDGKLLGVITDTDLLRLQTRTPLYLHQEIEAADSIEQLRKINARILEIVDFATRAGADTRSLVQLISHFNDAFTRRVIALLDAQEDIRLPEGAAYLALGSEGRGEQTLRTDQDSALVHIDDFPPEKIRAAERFASRLIDALEEIGIPRCPGNTIASNPQWSRSLSEWKQSLDQWISVPESENMVNFGMFQDLRAVHGNKTLETQLHEHILATVQRHSLFLPYVARNIMRFPPPLGMFGRIRVERRGAYRGKVDLKKAGIFALTEGVSLLALEAGIVGGSTWEKIERLRQRGILSTNDLEVVDEAFTYLIQLRLQRQLRALASGQRPINYIDPLIMTDKERDRLRKALKEVGVFLRIIRDRYKLDFISR